MSTQEATYFLLSLPLSKSSRKVFFINTSPIDERVVMLKNKSDLEKLDPDSDDVYMADIVKKYCKRSKKLENICLAEFAAYYHNIRNIDERNDDEAEEEGETENVRGLKKRTKAAVLRYRRYKLAQDPKNYYREQVLLLLPFRDEREDIENKDCEKLYNENLEIIERNGQTFGIRNDELLEEALENVECGRDIEEEDPVENANDYRVDILEQGGIGGNNDQQEKVRYTIPKRISSVELQALLDGLNRRQREFVDHVLNCFRTNDRAKEDEREKDEECIGENAILQRAKEDEREKYEECIGENGILQRAKEDEREKYEECIEENRILQRAKEDEREKDEECIGENAILQRAKEDEREKDEECIEENGILQRAKEDEKCVREIRKLPNNKDLDIENKDCEKLYNENLEIIERNGQTFGIRNDELLEEALENVECGRDIEEEDPVENANDYRVDILEQGGIGGNNDQQEKEKVVVVKV
ncbi:uncharacterized protein LOC103510000 [Diaphorina citri]|uniref:Uncharacterized protein LOC103510000 n=1 Tax=Diaphorina citri TaxID=121845 RepID=A0A1S4ECS0_DIACI|nr:uncharacterized protein LOC103510000 [Diaphorina citri]